MDALSLQRLQRWMEAGELPAWQALAEQGVLAPITSVVPSTTSAALTSFWTGLSPAEHGLTGYEMWLKEYGVVANTITLSPISFKGDVGSLSRAGLTPEKFIPFPTLGTHLAAQNVQSHAFLHYSIIHSGLSQSLFKDVNVSSYGTAADLWVNVRQLLERRGQERSFSWVYWSEVDTLSHRYGPDDERTVEEFRLFSSAFERIFLSKLNPEARQDTLLILSADHGQITTRPDAHYELRSHPGLARRLHILPTGEHRLVYLYIRPGQTEAVREYLERTWPNQFKILDPVYAIEAGLFGPGAPHPSLHERMGDLIVAAQDQAYLWWSEKENRMSGQHGGLSGEEMLVPFLAARLV
jgi:hypothetical protein